LSKTKKSSHGDTENTEKNNKEICMFVYPPPPPKLKGTTNFTNNTNKKNYFFRNKTIVNSFVSFVLFVVKKWYVWGL